MCLFHSMKYLYILSYSHLPLTSSKVRTMLFQVWTAVVTIWNCYDFFSSSFSFLSVNMQKKISPYYMKFKSLFFKGLTIISHLLIPHVFPFLTENSCSSLFLSPKCTPGPFIMWQLLNTYSNTWKVNQLQNKRVKQYTQGILISDTNCKFRNPKIWVNSLL